MHNLKIWNKKREEINPTHHRTGTCKSIIIMYDIIYKYPLYVNKGELVESSTDNINSASQTKMHCNAVRPNEPSGFHGHKAT